MKVWNLRCAEGHAFEGWFGSESDFLDQQARGLLSCPLCGEVRVERLPSAPRLNLSGAKPPAEGQVAEQARPGAPKPVMPGRMLAAEPSLPLGAGAAPSEGEMAALQGAWLQAVQQVMSQTEDVGERFPEEARRMHYGETEARGIRGQATPEQRAELREEGIETLALPVPAALKRPRH